MRNHQVLVLLAAALAACVAGDEDDAFLDAEIADDPGAAIHPEAVATTCLRADGPGGQDTYRLIESVLGRGAVEHPDDDHSPPVRHIREESDATVGHAFVFSAHRDIDVDGDKTDRSRMEIKVAPSSGNHSALKAREGSTFTYTWRFKLGSNIGFSNRFTHVFQLKSYEGDAGSPLITITGRKSGSRDRLEVIHTGPPTAGTLATADLAGLRGVWLDVSVRATFRDSGSLALTIKKPDGSTVLSVNRSNLDLWRAGDHIRPKWGIYRGLSDQLRAQEDTVSFASFAITPSATPTSNCR